MAITANGLIQWLAHHGSRFAPYDQEPDVAFLEALLEQGPDLLPQLCPPIAKAKPEQALLDAFVKSGILRGVMSQEVRVGTRHFTVEETKFDWRKSIDLLVESDGEVWVIEGKTRLNYEALGEVLTYATLWEDRLPGKQIRMGIVCDTIDQEILLTCHKYGVTVFEVIGSETRVHAPVRPSETPTIQRG